MSLGWALFSIFPSYLMLHYSFLGHKGLRFACEASKLLMCLTGLGTPPGSGLISYIYI